MNLELSLTVVRVITVYEESITHNLAEMAKRAGIYDELWGPERLLISKASQLVGPLKAGLDRLLETPDFYRLFDSEDGWGRYTHLVEFVEQYLQACMENEDADIHVNRQ